MKTFKFDIDGELVESSDNALAWNSPIIRLSEILPIADMLATWQDIPKLLPDVLVSPETYQGIRTATGYGHALDQSVINGQKIINGLQNSILDIARMTIIADPYMSKTYRQFRFPRSKKRRIRKKWSKDKRNWRYENIIYFLNSRKMPVRFINEELVPIPENRRFNGSIHNFS